MRGMSLIMGRREEDVEGIISAIEGIVFFIRIVGAITFVAFMVMLIKLIFDL